MLQNNVTACVVLSELCVAGINLMETTLYAIYTNCSPVTYVKAMKMVKISKDMKVKTLLALTAKNCVMSTTSSLH